VLIRCGEKYLIYLCATLPVSDSERISPKITMELLAIVFIPAKAFARDYVITGVGLSVCLSVCHHDNKIKRGRIWTKFFGKVPRGKSKPKFVSG